MKPTSIGDFPAGSKWLKRHDKKGAIGVTPDDRVWLVMDGRVREMVLASDTGERGVVAIASELARIDGYDPDDMHGGLYDLRWTGGREPEPAGDAWNMDYLPKAERIAVALRAQPAVQGGGDVVECEDCGGTGVTGNEYPGSDFEPPEPEYCPSCEGSGKWRITPDSAADACYQAYQAVGVMLSDLGLFDTERGQNLLDNLSQARPMHDVLPWESATPSESGGQGDAVAWGVADPDGNLRHVFARKGSALAAMEPYHFIVPLYTHPTAQAGAVTPGSADVVQVGRVDVRGGYVHLTSTVEQLRAARRAGDGAEIYVFAIAHPEVTK